VERRFLFRLDMAKDNDEFMNLRAPQADHVYAGRPIKLGPGWVPDFLEISVDRSSHAWRITIIELEATGIAARASCRKYLPEASAEVVRAFLGYLDVVISHCQSTSDPRLKEFQELKKLVGQSQPAVHTAGALRRGSEFVEDLLLIDQPTRPSAQLISSPATRPKFAFSGERNLTRDESDWLRRAVRILHAVLVGHDRSGGTFKSWRNHRNKPLDRAVYKDSAKYPHLSGLLSQRTVFGLHVDCERVASELARLWSDQYKPLDPARAAEMIRDFMPVAATFEEHEPMQKVFARARQAVEKSSA
jgi:hypothetical protein